MGKTVSEYRTYVSQWFGGDDCIATELLDAWLLEGWRKIIHVIRRWPHFEQSASAFVGGSGFPTGVFESIETVESPNGTLEFIDHRAALSRWGMDSNEDSTPTHWSQLSGVTYFWPSGLETSPVPLVIVGHREPTAWWSEGDPTAVPDMPAEFEGALQSFVLARAFLNQEDPELYREELRQFEQQVAVMLRHHAAASHGLPLVFGGRHPISERARGQRYDDRVRLLLE